MNTDPETVPITLALVRQPAVEAVLDWAFRQGYFQGFAAAKAYADAHGLGLLVEDGGIYSDRLVFFDSPKAAGEAIRQSPTYNNGRSIRYTRRHEEEQGPNV